MSAPHEDLLAKNGIATTDLPEKTQKKITKFATETDEDKRDSLDESIYGDVEDFIEAKAAKAKADAKKASHAAAKEKAKKDKTDVSGAPTATGAPTPAGQEPPKKERTAFDYIYGRK